MTAIDPAEPSSLLLRGPPGLAEVAQLLDDAIQHYADDNRDEWSLGCAAVAAAAKIAADNGWTVDQRWDAIDETAPMVTLDELVNAMLRHLYATRASDAPAVQP